MSETNGQLPRQCGNCKHWHRQPTTANTLGQPAQGECRFGPPTPTAIPQPQGLVIVCNYPNLPEGFRACGQYATKFHLAEIHE